MYLRSNSRIVMPARWSRRIAAYSSTFDICGAAVRALQPAPCGMSGGRPAASYRSVVPLDALCDTYSLADEVIGDPAGAAESGTPA
ncbi:hypothetical protein GCM10010521_22920 [Streptomyces rameus]|uniref:Uncharacterized protein n=1 Tax=Streptomyces rameus TaxID=68261 RepID=A0ABP6N992_9ACTN